MCLLDDCRSIWARFEVGVFIDVNVQIYACQSFLRPTIWGVGYYNNVCPGRGRTLRFFCLSVVSTIYTTLLLQTIIFLHTNTTLTFQLSVVVARHQAVVETAHPEKYHLVAESAADEEEWKESG